MTTSVYTTYIPALDASDYDTKIQGFITDVYTDVVALETTVSSHTSSISSINTAIGGGVDFNLNDGKAIVLGNGSDTRIEHINGTGTKISHDGIDGSLFLSSGANSIEISTTSINLLNNIYLDFGAGNCKLSYIPFDSTFHLTSTCEQKFETTGYNIKFGTTASDTSLIIGGSGGDITSIKKIQFSGTAGTALNDNGHITLGTGSDLDLYFDGTNGYIQQSAGNLYIVNADVTNKTYLQYGATPKNAIVYGGSSDNVELYYNNIKKLETTTDGITITGDVSITGAITATNIVCTVHTGKVNSAGTMTTHSGGLTSSRLGTGNYRITHNIGNIDYLPIFTVFQWDRQVYSSTINTNTFDLYITDMSGTATDTDFIFSINAW